MTEIALDDADIHSGLQEKRRVAVTKGMNGYTRLCYSGRFLGPDKGALDALSDSS